MTAPPDPPEEVGAVFDALPAPQRDALLALRRLIFRSAAEVDVELIETLKWGEPAYLPAEARVGTTVRINAVKGSPDGYALYVPCQTSLIDQYRLLYPDVFAFGGQRALLFSAAEPLPSGELKHCIALALTYHRR